jgi:hypothetical protein
MQFSTTELDKLKYTSFAIVGPPKTGKTRSLATLHKLRNRPWVQGTKLYVYDFDRGCQPLIRIAEQEGWAEEVRIVRFDRASGNRLSNQASKPTGTDRFLEFMNHVNHFYDMLEPDGTTWSPNYLDEAPYALVVDSATTFKDIVLEFTLGTRNKVLGGVGVDGRAEFGAQMEKLIECVRSMVSLPCFTVWLFHQQLSMGTVRMPAQPKGGRAIDPQITGVIAALPVITGQLAFTIGAEFGAILYTNVESISTNERKYQWCTSPDGAYIQSAGTRLKEGLPLYIDQDFDLVVE